MAVLFQEKNQKCNSQQNGTNVYKIDQVLVFTSGFVTSWDGTVASWNAREAPTCQLQKISGIVGRIQWEHLQLETRTGWSKQQPQLDHNTKTWGPKRVAVLELKKIEKVPIALFFLPDIPDMKRLVSDLKGGIHIQQAKLCLKTTSDNPALKPSSESWLFQTWQIPTRHHPPWIICSKQSEEPVPLEV